VVDRGAIVLVSRFVNGMSLTPLSVNQLLLKKFARLVVL
jgi:hypothetical protein